MDTPMTPDAFEAKLREIYRPGYDVTYAHVEADEFIEALLCALGYGGGVAFWREQKRWYD
jgi:hypothetical protein